MFEEFFHCVVW